MVRQAYYPSTGDNLKKRTAHGCPRLLIDDHEDPIQREAPCFFLGPPCEGLSNRVQKFHVSRYIRGDHGIADAPQRRPQPLFALTERILGCFSFGEVSGDLHIPAQPALFVNGGEDDVGPKLGANFWDTPAFRLEPPLTFRVIKLKLGLPCSEIVAREDH